MERRERADVTVAKDVAAAEKGSGLFFECSMFVGGTSERLRAATSRIHLADVDRLGCVGSARDGTTSNRWGKGDILEWH